MTKKEVGAVNIAWLVNNAQGGNGFDLSEGVEKTLYAMSPHIGQGWFEKIGVDDGIMVSRMVHDLKRSTDAQWIPQGDIKFESPVKNFHVGMWVRGACRYGEYVDGREQAPLEVEISAGKALVLCDYSLDATFFNPAGCRSDYLGANVPYDGLIELLGQEDVNEILTVLGVKDRKGSVICDFPLKLMAPLEQAMSGPFKGVAQRLHCMARVLDFLASLVHHCRSQTRQDSSQALRHKGRVRALHDYLSSLDGKLPSLGSLSKEFGMSARRLNEAFAAEYGQSIFAYITDQRLEAAHEVMVASSEPMKLVAERLGYAHVNHFIAAFKRKYGYTPGQLRRGGLLS